MKISISVQINLTLTTACNYYLEYFMIDYATDGNGGVNAEDLKKFLKETTKDSFNADVFQYVEEQLLMDGQPLDEIEENVNYEDAAEQEGYKEIYHYVANLYFK